MTCGPVAVTEAVPTDVTLDGVDLLHMLFSAKCVVSMPSTESLSTGTRPAC